MAARSQPCVECKRLGKYYETALARQASLSGAHLAAVQAGDLRRARELSHRLFDLADGAAQEAEKLKFHKASHEQRTRTLSAGIPG